ncbi:malate dehydrogenase (NAD) [Lacticaseibacillus pantheris DSM 15945 = JCM 12539 = NBRC 106106]|uniref:Malate dehydrogenase (NAD) n=1 Tax=Lacticaseibacillus pantheris DSM 15945 = JCM 12539 = NBRC 106106 TaxID=1423783 RepID=A0A0R1U4Y6_9LACO|nr:malate dehydrogenase (NAD) [Lacticaseibacillus pantheris DSM 15945 = JCM 12539 = NBRC 106106]
MQCVNQVKQVATFATPKSTTKGANILPRKIAVIGIGHVGEAVAHQIVTQGLTDRLVLIDKDVKKLTADFHDLLDAAANLTRHTDIVMNDWDAVADADIVISAVGKINLITLDHPDRFAELEYTSTQVKDVAEHLRAVGFNGQIVCISNPCDVMTMIYQQVTGLPANHVMGTGTMLDSARMRRAVGEAFQVDPRSVSGYNLGEHGNSQFTAWSTVSVMGRPIVDVKDEVGLDLDSVEHHSSMDAFDVFAGKGYTSFGIAAAATRLADTILRDARTMLPVSNWRTDLQCYLSFPVIVGADGVEQQTQWQLTDDEQQKLRHSADCIKDHFNQVMSVEV